MGCLYLHSKRCYVFQCVCFFVTNEVLEHNLCFCSFVAHFGFYFSALDLGPLFVLSFLLCWVFCLMEVVRVASSTWCSQNRGVLISAVHCSKGKNKALCVIKHWPKKNIHFFLVMLCRYHRAAYHGKIKCKNRYGEFWKHETLAPFFIGNFPFDNMPSKYTINFFCW